MKKVSLFILLSSIAASAQLQRYDSYAATTISASGIGNLTQVIPGATLQVFNYPGVGVSCAGGGCTAATTYTSKTGLTSCGAAVPLTRPTATTCLGTADAQGNFGFWALGGAYQYCVSALSLTTQCYNAVLGSTVDGNNAFTGLNTLSSINGVTWVDGVKFTTITQAVSSGACNGTIATKVGLTSTENTDIFAGFHSGACNGELKLDPTATITLNAQTQVPNGFAIRGGYSTQFKTGPSMPVDNTVNTNACSRNVSGVVTCTLNTSQTYPVGNTLVFSGFTSINGACIVQTSSGTALTCLESGGGTVASDGTTGASFVDYPMIVLGDLAPADDGSVLDSVTINCNNVQGIGIYAGDINENSGFTHVRVNNCTARGVKIEFSYVGSPQNFYLFDTYVVMSANSSRVNNEPIEIVGTILQIGGFRGLDQTTAVGGVTNNATCAICLTNVQTGVISRSHMERTTDGIAIRSGIGGSTSLTIEGASGNAFTTNVVHIYSGGTVRNINVRSITTLSSTNSLKDDITGVSCTESDLGSYTLNGNGKALTSSTSCFNQQMTTFTDFAGSATITATPPTSSTNTGWKLGLFSNNYAIGIGGNAVDVLIANAANGWLSPLSSLPLNNATATAPDSASGMSIGTNGAFVGKEVSAPTAAGAGFDECYGDSAAHILKCNYNNSTNFHGLRVTEVGTCTMAAGTCTLTWGSAFNATPLCNVTWNGTGTLTGFVKAVPSTSNCVITSSVGTDTGVMQVVGTGNPN